MRTRALFLTERRKQMRFDLSNFTYYENGNVFTGSRDRFNFRVAGEDGAFRVSVWYGLLAFDKAEIAEEKTFPFTPEGLRETGAYLEDRYRAMSAPV